VSRLFAPAGTRPCAPGQVRGSARRGTRPLEVVREDFVATLDAHDGRPEAGRRALAGARGKAQGFSSGTKGLNAAIAPGATRPILRRHGRDVTAGVLLAPPSGPGRVSRDRSEVWD
jgi:hypothetical protein